MTQEENYQLQTETMRKLHEAAEKRRMILAYMTENAGIFHGERVTKRHFGKEEREDREAYLDETK